HDTAATIKITYLPESGDPVTRSHLVAPGSRHTVNVNSDAGAGLSISATVTSDLSVVCERAMYFNYGDMWPGGHCVVGF
ncbi:MAG: hypothetical protein KKF66_08345, partial [Actinobacteria bacterium]|nr:hypothetical protein [Actinomycetota bacterium]